MARWADVTLATATAGNFVATVTSSGSVTVANSGSENAAVTVNLNMANANAWTALQSFVNASSTRFSVFDTLYVGGSATTTIRGDGIASTIPYASSTALSVSGTGYFGTASTTNLTASSLTSGRVPYVTTAGAFTDDADLPFDGTTLTAANLTSSGNVSLGNATTTNLAITNITSAIPLAGADGSLQEYAGSSCTNQFIRSLNGAGVATCAHTSEKHTS